MGAAAEVDHAAESEGRAARADVAKPTRKPRPPLTAAAMVALVRADVRYRNARRKAEKAEAERKALIATAVGKVMAAKLLGEWITARGWRIRIRQQSSGDSFSLAKYREKYKVTKQMAEFIHEGSREPAAGCRSRCRA